MALALQIARIGYFSYDLKKREYEISPMLVNLYNFPKDRRPTRADVLAATHPDDRIRVQNALSRVDETLASYDINYRVIGADGFTRVVRVIGQIVDDGDGRKRAFGTVQDLTAIERAHFFAKLNEERLGDFAQAASDWFWETDREHRLTFLSDRFETLMGYSRGELIGRVRTDYAARIEGDYSWQHHMEDLAARKPFRELCFWMRGASCGEERLVAISGVPVFDETNQFVGYRGVGRDITEDHKRRTELYILANYDSLTGLLNRQALEKKARYIQATSDKVYLVLLDLDRFKYINESCGQARGDLLLKAVGQRMTSWLPANCLIARFSSDDFAVLWPSDETPETMISTVETFLEQLAKAFSLDGLTIKVGAYAGISQSSRGHFERLLFEAEIALGLAKTRRAGAVQLFDGQTKQSVERRAHLETELRSALESNEFELAYQPQIDLSTDRVAGAEALLRWRSESFGIVSPAEFVPLAEELGLMPEIGKWVLEQAIAQCAEWRNGSFPSICVAINVSATQFLHDDVYGILQNLLVNYDLAADAVELEITESVFLQDKTKVAETMGQIRDTGARMALDDFGTGYSSLSYLSSFPVDRLKLDRSFVDPITRDKSAHSIVCGIINLAQSLGLEIVAEGVETQDHVEILKKLDCEYVQGFFYAKPLNAAEFARFVEERDQTCIEMAG